jgi:hypothetical protein
MPRSVRLSLWLFLGGVAVGFAMIPFDPRPWPPRPEAPVFITAVFLGAALFGALAFVAVRTYQGRNWARWVQLVLAIAALPGAIRDALAHLGGAPLSTTIYAAIFCAESVAVALLFTRSSSLWYRHASAGSPAS